MILIRPISISSKTTINKKSLAKLNSQNRLKATIVNLKIKKGKKLKWNRMTIRIFINMILFLSIPKNLESRGSEKIFIST